MKVQPWKKAVVREATLEREEKMLSGISGYLATQYSMGKKMAITKAPKTMRQITVALVQGKETPPYSSPIRNITVPPTTAREPSQSMVLRPPIIGVRGLCTLRKKRRSMKATPSQGTLKG